MRNAYNVKKFNSYKLKDSDLVLKSLNNYFNEISTEEVLTDSDGKIKKNLNGEPLKLVSFIKPPSLVGMANALGISVNSITKYKDRGSKIPSMYQLESQINEIRQAIDSNKQSVSFSNQMPTKQYHDSLMEAYEIKKIANILEWGTQMIETYNNEMLYTRDGNRGAVFTLKANFNYSEKQELDINVGEKRKLEDFIGDK